MAHSVVDHTSNIPEQIEQAARLLGKPKSQKFRVFAEIYRGQKPKKTVAEVMKGTKITQRRVLDAGKALDSHGLVSAKKIAAVTSYHKIPFFVTNRDKVLKYARDPVKLKTLATKRRPDNSLRGRVDRVAFTARLPRKRARAIRITVDDLGSFSKVKGIADSQPYIKVSESAFKNGVAKILGENGKFKDWGGENRDLSSTRLRIDSTKRRVAAFAFKGPGKGGKLVPGKMGKNGDQIQRLVLRCQAEVFIVQFWREIDDSVTEQLEAYARLKAYMLDEPVWYGIIEGSDSVRIMKAYPALFPKLKTKG